MLKLSFRENWKESDRKHEKRQRNFSYQFVNKI